MIHGNLFELIQAIGYIGLFAIVFAETGLLLGFFLPGDSLLFTAGILAAEDVLHIWPLLIVLCGAAIIGDSVGYSIGRRLGPRIFSKEESLLFNKKHLQRAQDFFDRHGPKTIIIARFVPIVRTFAPTLAGVGKMSYPKFLTYNIVGGLIWVLSITLLGYYLGLKVENVEAYVVPGVVIIILLSLAPYIKAFITNPEIRREVFHYIRRIKDKMFPKKQ
jgi:membrane-associated protein